MVIFVNEETNGGEGSDEGKEDHGRHGEEAEDVSNAGNAGDQDRYFQRFPYFQVDGAFPAEVEAIEVGYAVDGAEEYLCYMVVQVPGQGTEEELSTDNRDQGCSDKAGFPVPDFPDKDKDDRDHQCRKDRWYPEGSLDDLRPGCCSRNQACNTADKGE